jgi:acetyltransferase-like isoleucine patch superfamily enzyme
MKWMLRRLLRFFSLKKIDAGNEYRKNLDIHFKNTPQNVTIEFPRRIINPHRMWLGDNIYIGPGSLLMAVEKYSGITPPPEEIIGPLQKFEPELIIGNRVTATGMLQVSVLQNIVIEDDVMFASNVFICDAAHGYKNADIPYKYQPMQDIKSIRIKKGSWIGQNVVILPGVEIGEYCIIGANSVVTKSIPNKCIALGSPARIIKKWSAETRTWEINPE